MHFVKNWNLEILSHFTLNNVTQVQFIIMTYQVIVMEVQITDNGHKGLLAQISVRNGQFRNKQPEKRSQAPWRSETARF